jgi:hypothetical protein
MPILPGTYQYKDFSVALLTLPIQYINSGEPYRLPGHPGVDAVGLPGTVADEDEGLGRCCPNDGNGVPGQVAAWELRAPDMRCDGQADWLVPFCFYCEACCFVSSGTERTRLGMSASTFSGCSRPPYW